jgi:phage tail-like protein
MARTAFSDFLQVYPFWLFDVAPIEGISLPIFNPLSGFSTITAPGVTHEMFDITEGNWHFRRKVIKKADIEAMTLTRGVTFFDSDFWRWMVAGLTGDPQGFQIRSAFNAISIGGPTPRRTLVLIQFFARNPIGSTSITGAAQTAAVAANAGLITANTPGNFGKAVVGSLAGGAGVAGFVGGGNAAFGPFEFTVRMPAKAWILHDCLPVRYKAGGDFDASASDISIQELEIQPEMIEELSLTA